MRNTYLALTNVEPGIREAARGIGMTFGQRLRMVELPIAVPVILAGVRTAVVMNIGVMTIAATIGAGGLAYSSSPPSAAATCRCCWSAPCWSACWQSSPTCSCKPCNVP